MVGNASILALNDFIDRYDRAIFNEETRALYDGTDFYNVGDWGDHPAGSPSGLGQAARRLIERHLAFDPPEAAAAARVVLDIGCGLGPATKMMTRHYPAALVLGINISATQVGYAAHGRSAARFLVMDAVHLAVASESVDRIHAIEAAFHFRTRFDFLREAYRVLRPGGKIILTDMLFRRRLAGVPDENRSIDAVDYKDTCATVGFVVEYYQDVTQHTVRPFCHYLAAKGKRAHSIALRRAVAAYYLVVLRRPC